MNKLREKGVSLLEPKNKGVLTVNFKHPILKDYKGNGRIITKSLGADVGKDYEAANKFLNEIKSIINNSDCYENYYGFLKSLEKYSEKSMKIVFDNTHFMEEFYYDFKKSILEKFIGISHNNINKKLEEELKEFFKLLKLEEFELMDNSNKSFEIFVEEEIKPRFNFEFKKKIQLLGGDYGYRKKLISNLIGSIGEFSEGYKNTNEAREDKLVNKFFNNMGVPNFEVIFKQDSNKFKFIGTPYSKCIINKKINLKGILKEFLFRINSLENIFQYKLEFRERKSGKSYVFNNNELLVKRNFIYNKGLDKYPLDNIEDLAYIYFHIGYKENYKEKSQEELKLKFFYILKSLFNEKYNPNSSSLIFSDIRLEGNFRGEILHNKEKDFILADYSGNINEFRNQLLSYETRRNLASSDEIIWLFNIEEEAFERNLEVLKYLIINGYLNKTNIYIYEKSIYKDYFSSEFDNSESNFISALNEKEAYNMPNIFNSFLKDNFQNLLEELGEEEASIIIRGREEYYLNLIMERVIFPCDEEKKVLSNKDVIEKIINQSEEVLINKIKEKSSLINEYKPSYKYERLVGLSLGINRKVKREFIRRVRRSYDKNLKEFSLRMAYNFGGREFKSLCLEKLLETSIKNSIKTFLLNPYKIRKDINILEFEKSIEYIMESISEKIIEEVEILIREDNLLKWKEAAELILKEDIIEGRNLIEEIIEETFVVSNDIFREDRVLKIIKEVLKNNSIFKEIKGEFVI
ncbi:hypothetical protein PTL48_05750 [Clostridium perfringens]|uniref:hypothetical protein n=1 Tax=Clostridium perfringens TaxID=1502 RepID=UPI002A6449CA|nr:hypothetical protein [Clostridium perfringens]MDJ9041620.1 hypothetical protein [Clostridium perfringens]MDJ9049038.1 hypothetical protein [Clostridium perfringens]MDJ9056262.1 hypothetical protein [Clostridium perfringens]MDJ9063743.1 hypothetical protein [Clostridium perfringens]